MRQTVIKCIGPASPAHCRRQKCTYCCCRTVACVIFSIAKRSLCRDYVDIAIGAGDYFGFEFHQLLTRLQNPHFQLYFESERHGFTNLLLFE